MRAPAAKSRRETVELFISPSAASRRVAAGERISGRLRPPAPRRQGRIAQLAEQPRGNQSAGVSVVRVHVRPQGRVAIMAGAPLVERQARSREVPRIRGSVVGDTLRVRLPPLPQSNAESF